MTLHDITAGAVALLVASSHAVTHFALAFVRALAARKTAVSPAKPVTQTIPQRTIMTDATIATASPAAASIFSAIHTAASKALGALTLIGNDWAAIKANPLYGTLAAAAVDSAKAELAANGIPVDGAVNVAVAVEGMLTVLAAAHPTIVTP